MKSLRSSIALSLPESWPALWMWCSAMAKLFRLEALAFCSLSTLLNNEFVIILPRKQIQGLKPTLQKYRSILTKRLYLAFYRKVFLSFTDNNTHISESWSNFVISLHVDLTAFIALFEVAERLGVPIFTFHSNFYEHGVG